MERWIQKGILKFFQKGNSEILCRVTEKDGFKREFWKFMQEMVKDDIKVKHAGQSCRCQRNNVKQRGKKANEKKKMHVFWTVNYERLIWF